MSHATKHRHKLLVPEPLNNKELDAFTMRDLYNVHLQHEPALDIDEKKDVDEDTNINDFYQLVFDIKHCMFKAGNDTKLLFSIFDDTTKRIISEEYCLYLSENNFPKLGSSDDCKVLFKNLSSDILQHNIYIICHIYRIGQMKAPK
eukprot:430712_1